MIFSISFEVSPDISSKLDPFRDCAKEMEHFFAERDYGPGIAALYLGLTCVSDQFKEFFPKRKPRYVLGGKRTMDHTEVVYIPKTFMYDLLLDYQTYSKMTNSKPKIATEIISSLKEISEFGRVKDFDLERFRSDLTMFFKDIKYIPRE